MLTPGLRWSKEEGSMVMHHNVVEEDRNSPPDVRTAREVAKMGNSINPMIQLTADCPSSNPSGMMPLLDIQVWIEDNKVMYQHYRKPMANPLLMLEPSAMPAFMKKTALTQGKDTPRKNFRRRCGTGKVDMMSHCLFPIHQGGS